MYKVKEAGKNGTVEIQGNRIVRTFKKRIGKDDVQIIPASSVSHVDLDRKTMRSDTVTVHVGNRSFEWKTPQAEQLAHAILALKD